ncbi:MAG: hypothetical protein ACYC1D_09550 [Acidimicrobiales bacterium]
MNTGMAAPASLSPVEVVDDGTRVAFSFDEMLRYSGPGSPAGVALAYQAMQCGFPQLAPVASLERREITVETPFGGPGARDGFELVTRAVNEGRYTVDFGLKRPERGPTLEAFLFHLAYRDRKVTLLVQEGVVSDEFVLLAQKEDRDPNDERRLTELKAELANRLLASSPGEVFHSEPTG